MANPLYQIPGLGGYQATVDANQQRGLGQLQQAQALMGLQGLMQKQAQEQAFRTELAQAPDDAARQAVALKYASPDKALDIQTRTAERKDAAEQRAAQFAETLNLKQQALEQQKELALSRASDKASQDAINNQFREQQLILQRQQQQFQRWATEQNIDLKKFMFENRPEKPITEFQGKNALYGSRAAASDRTLNSLEEKISLVGLATKESMQSTPVIGGALGAAANVALSADQQKVEQAQRDFVNAVLRQESGAVISAQEFDNAKKQYFPQPGDKPDVIAQKKANRKLAIEGFKRIAGPAWASVEEQLKQSNIAPSSDKVIDFGSLK